mgnify:CR=1 FL=1
MSKIGFKSASSIEEEQDNVVTTDQKEEFVHTIRFLGVPIWKSTKHHTVDIKTIEK